MMFERKRLFDRRDYLKRLAVTTRARSPQTGWRSRRAADVAAFPSLLVLFGVPVGGVDAVRHCRAGRAAARGVSRPAPWRHDHSYRATTDGPRWSVTYRDA